MNASVARNRVRDYLLKALVNGTVHIGDRLSLAELANELNCSVTPVREALTQLEYSNVIQAVPNRGFIIPELSVKEATHLYQLIAALEATALQYSSFSNANLKYLQLMQKKFEACTLAANKVAADMLFHEALTSGYGNPILQQTIRDVKIRIFFYEQAFMVDDKLSDISTRQHRQIIDALKCTNKKKAISILAQNWFMMLSFLQSSIRSTMPQ
jgi:DNA-binding GntR family transcriptional regulator